MKRRSAKRKLKPPSDSERAILRLRAAGLKLGNKSKSAGADSWAKPKPLQ